MYTSDGHGAPKRWYDKDPALSQALKDLKQASTAYQAQIALNIIKIIVEHRIESESGNPVEAIRDLLETTGHSDDDEQFQRRRWYDVDETLHSAMQLLHDCPPDLQKSVIPSITQMIEDTLGASM
jgi:hypothetical protein